MGFVCHEVSRLREALATDVALIRFPPGVRAIGGCGVTGDIDQVGDLALLAD